jgi:hypothetical protein
LKREKFSCPLTHVTNFVQKWWMKICFYTLYKSWSSEDFFIIWKKQHKIVCTFLIMLLFYYIEYFWKCERFTFVNWCTTYNLIYKILYYELVLLSRNMWGIPKGSKRWSRKRVNFLSLQFIVYLHFRYLRYTLFIDEQYQKQNRCIV